MKTEKKQSPSITFLHEVQKNNGKHRIVIFNNGFADAGLWFEFHQTALHKNLFANLHNGALPIGIFTVTPKAHQTLES